MASIADVYVTVIPETSRVAQDIKAAFRAVDKDAAEAGRRWGKEIKDAIGPIKPEVEPETAKAKTELEKFRAEQERKKIRQKIEFDESDFKEKLSIMGREFDGVGAKFGSGLKVNLGLAGIGLLPAAATAITDVAGSIQQLAGAGLALPGIFAGLASSVGVAMLATHGMGDALKALEKATDGTKAHVKAANAALAALPESAADAVKSIFGLRGTFEDLQKIAAGNLFQGFSGGLKTLVAADLPAVTKGIDGISRGLNTNLRQAMTSLGSGSSQGFLSRIFGNTTDAQAIASRAIDPLVHAFGTLTAAGSDTLPRLATALGNVADRFNAFITNADGDGRLKKWINEGLDGFTHLGNILLDIGRTFTGLTSASGGGAGLLSMLENLTSRMATFVNSTAGQQKLRDFFQQGRDMLGQLRDVAIQVGPVLGGLFQAGIGAANIWLPIIERVLNIINDIPGGAAAVVYAFAAWKTMQGPIALINSLNTVMSLLKVALPAAAAEGAAGISSGITAGLAGITLPAWMTAILGVAGGAASLVAITTGFGYVGNEILHNAPNSNENARARGAQGIAGVTDQALPTDPRNPRDPMSGGGVNQSHPLGVPTLPAAPSAWGFQPRPGSPAAAAAAPPRTGLGFGSNVMLTPGVTVPDISTYSPPVVTEVPKGGSSATPNLPYTGTADPYTGTGAYGGMYAGAPSGAYPGESARDFAHRVEQPFYENEGLTVGDHAADKYGEHQNGALDIMVSSIAEGTKVLQQVLSDPNTYGAIFNNQTYGYGHGTTPQDYSAGHTGDPSQDHINHVHAFFKPGGTNNITPIGPGGPGQSMYPGMDPGTGLTSSDLTLRNAQQRVNDTQHTQEQAEARLNELKAKGTATDRQLEAAEYAVAKAKREHQDAIDGLTVATDKYNKSAAAGQGGDTGGNQLGQDIFGGIAQIFGFDGSLFKDPTQFGLFKIFKSAMGLKPAGATSGAPSGGGMPSGGGDLFSGLAGLAQNFMPGAGGSSPNILGAVQNAQPGGPGSPGPGNPGNNPAAPLIDLRGASFGDSHNELKSQLNDVTSSANRWAPLAQNLPH